MSHLVGNPEDRFSRVAAHFIIMFYVNMMKSERDKIVSPNVKNKSEVFTNVKNKSEVLC